MTGNRRPRRRLAPTLLLALCSPSVAALSGCWGPAGNAEYERELGTLRAENNRQAEQLLGQKAALDECQRRLTIARGLKPEDMKLLFYPDTLVIDALSGGEDYDGKPGDDGVTVYLKPVDRAGDVLKSAGDIAVELYDLAAEPGQNRIGEYKIPVDKCGELWNGKLLTYHYAIRCPFPAGRPKNTEITIRATFVDYITQRVLTAQKVCTVRLAP
ncbi:hypothetical protein RAS1_33500 [Phycisphaerae bacterium RAS1]|nr:hypothetical protein RAS1_33500 [Phycisphaerae bacterium RAS1]